MCFTHIARHDSFAGADHSSAYRQGSAAAIPLFKRAVELDPNFAVSYAALGISYSNLGEPGLANENLRRAYELRDRVSEREKLRISALYNSYFDGDLVKGSEIYGLWAQTYPRDGIPVGNLGAINLYSGNYQKALTETLEHLHLDPDDALGYGNLIVTTLTLIGWMRQKRLISTSWHASSKTSGCFCWVASVDFDGGVNRGANISCCVAAMKLVRNFKRFSTTAPSLRIARLERWLASD